MIEAPSSVACPSFFLEVQCFRLTNCSSECWVQTCLYGCMPIKPLPYLAHEASGSRDEHIFPCKVFWDVHHDACGPARRDLIDSLHLQKTRRKTKMVRRTTQTSRLNFSFHVEEHDVKVKRKQRLNEAQSRGCTLERSEALDRLRYSRNFWRLSNLPTVIFYQTALGRFSYSGTHATAWQPTVISDRFEVFN